MHELNNLFAIAASDYQSGMAVLNHMGHIARHCLGLLRRAEWRPLATCDGKSYHVFRAGSPTTFSETDRTCRGRSAHPCS